MNSNYCISFFDKTYVLFNAMRFANFHRFLTNIQSQDFFMPIQHEEIEHWIRACNMDIENLLTIYEPPPDVRNARFEHRSVLVWQNRRFVIDPTNVEHFNLQLIAGIIYKLDTSALNKVNFYLMPRRNLVNENQLELIFSIKRAVLNENIEIQKDALFKLVVSELPTVNDDIFIHTVNKLIEYEILSYKTYYMKGVNYDYMR